MNINAIKATDRAKFDNNLILPLYRDYCFSNIPGTILSLFGVRDANTLPADVLRGRGSSKVVFIFVDGFGWISWELVHDKYPALIRFEKKGVVSPITSQFPSTTSAHITTIHTGLDVGQTGIYEWYYYEPKLDAIISPIKFSFAGDENRETLTGKIKPTEILPTDSIYQVLSSKGVKSYVFQPQEYLPSSYLNVVLTGTSHVVPYPGLNQGLDQLVDLIKTTDGPAYYFFYYSKLDTIGHTNGPNTSAHLAAMKTFFTSLENKLFKKVEEVNGLTILMSADHGMVKIDPNNTFYLNKEIPELYQYIKRNRSGDLLTPEGSCRDFFMHVRDNYLDTTKKLLEDKLNGIAQVYSTEELIEMKLFNVPSTELLNRLGNLAILPHKNESVWWYEEGIFEQKFYGHHGGLTFDEMVVPFLSMDMGKH